MPRSIWNGVISFGMVSIPVKLFTATDSKDISFHLLHQECETRLQQRRWCPNCEREVEWGEAVRGYEWAKEQHIVLGEEDFAKLPLASKHTIELSAFVEAKEIDSIFYDKSYYLEPDETGVKPFALLMRALQEKRLTAIAKIAIRNKEQLCALRPYDGALILETMFYPDELRVEKGQELPEVQVNERELDMAFALIDLLSEPFAPEKYEDEYREALMAVIESKLQGVEMEAPEAVPAKVVDLVSALKASIEAAKKRKSDAGSEQEEATDASQGKRSKAATA